MSPSLYLAGKPRSIGPAMLVIVKSRGAAGLVSCRSALLFPTRPSAPILREFSRLTTAVSSSEAEDAYPHKLLHELALKQAACDTTDAFGPVLPGDFERTAWLSLLHWTLLGKITCEELTMVANHVGSMDGSGRLHDVARDLKAIRRRLIL